MEIAIASALALFSLAVVVFPLLRSQYGGKASGEETQPSLEALEFQAIRESIESLQLDYQLGKVTTEHYREQLQAYRLAAADVLRRQGQDQPNPATGPEPADETDGR